MAPNYDTILATRFVVQLSFVILLSLVLLATELRVNYNNAHAQTPGNDNANAANGTLQNPPLRSSTALGNYIVELSWKPNSLWIGNETTFYVQFLDKGGKPLASAVNYDFSVTGSDLSQIYELDDQITDDRGVAKPMAVIFEKPGQIQITVWANPGGTEETTDVQSESATFNLAVAPEFPLIMPIVIVSGALAAVVIITRSRLQHYNNR